jgi:protein xylosyltransferase
VCSTYLLVLKGSTHSYISVDDIISTAPPSQFHLFSCVIGLGGETMILFSKKMRKTSSRQHSSLSLALRWIFRYKLFFLIGFLIFGMQLFLIFKSNFLPKYSAISLNGKRALDDHIFPVDDEDLHSNSNVFTKTNDLVIDEKKLNRSALFLKDLDFVPACQISNNREALSALHRAKTMECKKQIADIVCNIQKGMFYPKTLPNYCPNGNFTANRPLGCYKDEKTFRILASYYVNFKTTNTPRKCIQLCLQSGFQYAGVQYS